MLNAVRYGHLRPRPHLALLRPLRRKQIFYVIDINCQILSDVKLNENNFNMFFWFLLDFLGHQKVASTLSDEELAKNGNQIGLNLKRRRRKKELSETER